MTMALSCIWHPALTLLVSSRSFHLRRSSLGATSISTPITLEPCTRLRLLRLPSATTPTVITTPGSPTRPLCPMNACSGHPPTMRRHPAQPLWPSPLESRPLPGAQWPFRDQPRLRSGQGRGPGSASGNLGCQPCLQTATALVFKAERSLLSCASQTPRPLPGICVKTLLAPRGPHPSSGGGFAGPQSTFLPRF